MLSILTDAKRRPSTNVGGGDWRPSSCSLSISFCSPCITANPSRRRSAKEVALESYHYFSKFIPVSLSLLEKDVFCLVTSMGQRKNSGFLLGIESQTFGFRVLMLYHWATESLQWTRSITKSIFSCLPKLTPWHVVKQGYIKMLNTNRKYLVVCTENLLHGWP